MAPVLADHIPSVLSRLPPRIEKSSRPGLIKFNPVILALLIVIAVISLPWFKRYLPFPQNKSGLIYAETPVDATKFLLAERPIGELFHDMGYGSYLIWAAYPDYGVFVDPRIELYSSEIWLDYIAIVNAIPGWEQTLEKYQINTLLLNPHSQNKLIENLMNSSIWRLVYSDPVAVIYVSNNVE